MMRKDAIAALFDALVFLSIAALVSVALLSAFSGGEGRPNGEQQTRVDAAHLVLLRSTVEDGDGNNHSVEELFKLNGVAGSEVRVHIETTMDLLVSGSGWRWTVTCGDFSVVYGTSTVPGAGEPLFCSLVRAPLDGEEMVFRLEVWNI